MSRSPSAPSEQLRHFLRGYISSYEELEVLLLLARPPAGEMTAAALAAALKVPSEAIAASLEALLATGRLLRSEQRADATYYSYAPQDEQLRHVLIELEQAYSGQRLAIIQIMSANSLDRLRGAAARRLADAFRLERPKK